MICFLTERRLKPGTWDDFRRAWEPDGPPPAGGRAYHVRDLDDPDHVISFGLFDVDRAHVEGMRADANFAGGAEGPLRGDGPVRRRDRARTAASR